MEEQLTEPTKDNNQISVREPTERLIDDRTATPEKGKAVIKDVQMKTANSNWYGYAVLKIRYSNEDEEKIVLPVYETDYVDVNLDLLLNYSSTDNLYGLIGTRLPAVKNNKGKWMIYIPSERIPKVESLLFETSLTRVSGDSIKLSIGVPALIGVIASTFVLLSSTSYIFSLFIGVIVFLVTTPMIRVKMPGEIL